MNKNNLTNKEERFGEILSELQWEVNTDDIWAALEGNLPESEEKKRRFLPWFLGLGALVLIIGSSSLFFNNEAVKTSEQFSNNITNTSINNIEDKKSIDNSSWGTESIEVIESNAIENSKELNSTNNRIVKTKSSESKSKSKSKVKLAFVDTENNKRKALNLFSSKVRQSSFVKTIRTEKKESKEGKINDVATSIETRSLVNVSTVSILKTSPLTFIRDINSKAIIPAHRRTSSPFYVSVGVGSILPKWSHSSSADFEVANEIAIPGYSGQLSLGYQVNNRIFVEGGVRLSEAVARYNNQYTDQTTQNIDGVESIHINSFGATNEQLGTIQETTINHYDLQWHRKHRSVDLFTNIGIELARFKNWNFSSMGGVSYNLNTSHTGYYLGDSSNSGIEQFEEVTHPYKKQVGISWMGGLRIGYQINAFEVNISTFYKNNLGSLTQDSNPFLIKSSQIGLELGMVYRPNWE